MQHASVLEVPNERAARSARRHPLTVRRDGDLHQIAQSKLAEVTMLDAKLVVKAKQHPSRTPAVRIVRMNGKCGEGSPGGNGTKVAGAS
jgi:hypothetical protein